MKQHKPKLKTGAQMVVDIIVDEGVEMLWGLTGGAVLPDLRRLLPEQRPDPPDRHAP